MNTRSATEWRDFWRDSGERKLASLLDEFEEHTTRVATLLGSRAPLDALVSELGRIRVHELRDEPDAQRDTEIAQRIHTWFADA